LKQIVYFVYLVLFNSLGPCRWQKRERTDIFQASCVRCIAARCVYVPCDARKTEEMGAY